MLKAVQLLGLIILRRSALALVMAAASIANFGCCTQNQLVGRYQSALCDKDNKQVPCASIVPQARAFAVSIKTPSSAKEQNGTTFSDRAFAEYIRVLGNRQFSSTADALRANLAADVSGPSASVAEDRTVFHRTIIVSVRKTGAFNPADRLEATEVTIRPTNATFESWDTLATVYTMINAGTVQLTQARGANEAISVGTPATVPVSATGSLGASQTNTRVENFTASNQVETISATIEDQGGALTIHRQGGGGVDLTGNTVIKVDLVYNDHHEFNYVFAVGSYRDKSGKLLPPKKAALKVKPIFGVPPGHAIEADVTLNYTLRHIISGDATYEEADDDIQEMTNSSGPERVTLVSAREASPSTFSLVANDAKFKGDPIVVARPGYRLVELRFESYSQASDFLAYMKAADPSDPSVVGSSRLGFLEPPSRFTPLTSAQLRTLKVESSEPKV